MDIKKVQEICDKVLRESWVYDEGVGCVAVYKGNEANCIEEVEEMIFYKSGDFSKGEWKLNENDINTAKFIITAKEVLPWALREIEHLRGQVKYLEYKGKEQEYEEA